MYSKQTISIPRSINHENQEYLITSLSLDTYVYGRSMIENFKFAPDSELRTIENKFSFTCSITSLTIPSSVTELEDGWCRAAVRQTYVSVMPNNRRYLSIDNKFIICFRIMLHASFLGNITFYKLQHCHIVPVLHNSVQ